MSKKTPKVAYWPLLINLSFLVATVLSWKHALFGNTLSEHSCYVEHELPCHGYVQRTQPTLYLYTIPRLMLALTLAMATIVPYTHVVNSTHIVLGKSNDTAYSRMKACTLLLFILGNLITPLCVFEILLTRCNHGVRAVSLYCDTIVWVFNTSGFVAACACVFVEITVGVEYVISVPTRIYDFYFPPPK